MQGSSQPLLTRKLAPRLTRTSANTILRAILIASIVAICSGTNGYDTAGTTTPVYLVHNTGNLSTGWSWDPSDTPTAKDMPQRTMQSKEPGSICSIMVQASTFEAHHNNTAMGDWHRQTLALPRHVPQRERQSHAQLPRCLIQGMSCNHWSYPYISYQLHATRWRPWLVAGAPAQATHDTNLSCIISPLQLGPSTDMHMHTAVADCDRAAGACACDACPVPWPHPCPGHCHMARPVMLHTDAPHAMQHPENGACTALGLGILAACELTGRLHAPQQSTPQAPRSCPGPCRFPSTCSDSNARSQTSRGRPALQYCTSSQCTQGWLLCTLIAWALAQLATPLSATADTKPIAGQHPQPPAMLHILPCRRASDSKGQPRLTHVRMSRARRSSTTAHAPHLVANGPADWVRAGASGRTPSYMPTAAPPQDMFFEHQQQRFCQVHAANNAAGMHLLSGPQLIAHCVQLARAHPIWLQAFDAATGNFSVFALNHWLQQHTGTAYCRHAILTGSSRDSAILTSLASLTTSTNMGCLLQLSDREHAVALRYHQGIWWLLDSELPGPVPLQSWRQHQPLTGTVYVQRQVADIDLILPPALQLPPRNTPGATGSATSTQVRPQNGSVRKKGQPKRSCVQCSPANTEYILTLLGNFQHVQSKIAAQAWMLSSAIRTLQSLATEATGLYIVNDNCIQVKLSSPTVMRHLRTSDSVSHLQESLRQHHDCRCVLQSDAEILHYRRRAASRPHALAQPPRASKHARHIDHLLRFANYYDPLDDDQPCPDANTGGVKQTGEAPPRRPPQARQRSKPAASAPLILATWNATALTPTKTHELLSLASKAHVLVIAVQETWENKKWQPPQIIANEYNYTWCGCPRAGQAGGGVGFFVHNSIRDCVTFKQEPRAQQDNSLEMMWLQLHLKHRKQRCQQLSVASVYMPNSSRNPTEIDSAWDAFGDALSNEAVDDKQCIILGDLNARIGSAETDGDRIGRHGEPADDDKSVNRAGRKLLQALDDHDLYVLNSRQPPVQPDDNYTFVTTATKSILDYAIVTDHLYHAGSVGTVLDPDKWSIGDSPHRVLGMAVPLRLPSTRHPKKRKAHFKWRTDALTCNDEKGNEMKAKYQHHIQKQHKRIKALASKLTDVNQLLAAVVNAFVTAGKASIGLKRIVPGRTNSWWTSDIKNAIAVRRQLYAAMRRLGTSQSREAYREQQKVVKQLVRKAQYLKQVERAYAINTQYKKKVNDKSNLGEKPFWNELQKEPGFKRSTPPQAPQALKHPDTGKLATAHTEILQAQVAHTRILGSQHAFHGANPHFDVAHAEHVSQQVRAYDLQNESMCRSKDLPGCMNDPITADEILQAMSKLKNGKAASPTTGIPNELLKYGGQPAAELLLPVFNMVWESGTTPDQWREGVIQYFHKSGDTTDMANYRGITLLDVISKLFNKILANRIIDHVEANDLLHEGQNAFRKGRSTDEHIYTLSQVAKGRQRAGQATFAFYLDLRKAYDTVWRDALMYKLWQKGVQGKLWRYISNMYSRTERSVRCGDAKSHMFPIDLGTAQGDTLSCILFDIYVDDLLREVEHSSSGVTLPVTETADTTSASDQSARPADARLKALMFADDFTGVAATAADLQNTVDVCERWCTKWRMSANIGPKKSAYMIFAPEHATKNDKAHKIQWRGTAIPRVNAYRYLGVMLHENCRWDCHLAYTREKGLKATYAMASVLHKRSIHLAVRRIVLQACIRPVVEYASTVWHGTVADMQRLEQIQYRVLKRMAATHENVATELLSMEFGCRSYASWAMQRKLEFRFRLRRMPQDRLPAIVSKCEWQRKKGAKKPAMHTSQVLKVSRKVDLDPDQHAADPELTYAAFKKQAALAVRRHDVNHVRLSRKSTVKRYLENYSHINIFPNKLQPYLDGPLTRSMQNKLLFRTGFAPVGHLQARKVGSADANGRDASCAFCACVDETAEHFVLQCPAFERWRAAMRSALRDHVGDAAYTAWEALTPQQQLHALLDDHRWGKQAPGVDYIAQTYLSDILRERAARLESARCTHSAGFAGARAHGSDCSG